MILKLSLVAIFGLCCFWSVDCDQGITCKNFRCGENQMCAACGQNVCNTFSCFNPDGSKIRCLYKCPKLNPTCICKPNYHRADASSPCVPLSCPTTNPTTKSSTPTLTCDNIKCGRNEECAACGQNACNTYSCFNPIGSKFICLFKCPQLNPTCICKPFYHRLNPKGPCVPLFCPTTASIRTTAGY